MVCKVSWTLKALETYIQNIQYLESEWTNREVEKFITNTEKKIQLLSAQPRIGSSRSKRQTNIRHTILHKRIILVYRYKPRAMEIELLAFWNTYQNPKKLKVSER